MTHQELRNALCEVEDAARSRRNAADAMVERDVFGMIARLAQLVRENIVQ